MNPNPSHTDVLIVGAGPTGLTLACELARRGVRHRIIEAAPTPFTGSRAKGTQPRSLEVFDDLGIVDEVIAGGRFHMPMRLYGEDGSSKDVDPHEGRQPSPDVPYASTLIVAQARVEAILRKRLAQSMGTVQFGSALTSLTQDESGVAATITHAGAKPGLPGQPEVVRARWLVGCDGGRSATRHQLGLPFEGTTAEQQRMIVADVELNGLDRDFWHIWQGKAGFFALAPLPASNAYQLQAALGDEVEQPSEQLLRELLKQRTGRSEIELVGASWMSLWRANVRMVERYRVRRVLLAGDAAHVHSPAGAQGMNTGIQDAYNLGWKLAAVINGAADELLDSYEEERLPIAAWVLGLSTRLSEGAFAARGLFTRRGPETLQLELNYRGCRLSIDERPGCAKVVAGDRAPDSSGLAPCIGTGVNANQVSGATKRLFDLYRGTHFTLVAFGESVSAPLDHLARRFGSALACYRIVEKPAAAGSADATPALLDPAGATRSIYGAAAGDVLLVRPDGYVGFAAHAPTIAALAGYLESVLAREPVNACCDRALERVARDACRTATPPCAAQEPRDRQTRTGAGVCRADR